MVFLAGSFVNPMAAVALAWESQSTRSVGCSAIARQAARFTAVVVFPTPPFWFAIAMIRDNITSQRKFSKANARMQDVSREMVVLRRLRRISNEIQFAPQTSLRLSAF